MKLTVSQFRDGALVLSCGDGGAEVDLVFAAGAMHGDPGLDNQRAILEAIIAMHAENERLREAWREILSGHCPSKYPMTDAGLIAYHRDLSRAALKEAK